MINVPKQQLVNVDQLQVDGENPNKMTDKQLARLKTSVTAKSSLTVGKVTLDKKHNWLKMVKTMYPKTITEKIVEYWGLGFSASETRQILIEKQGVTCCLNTIYKHRHSLTAQDLVDELIRRQQRAIFKADVDTPEVGMKYRNELLKILLPQRIESLSIQKIEQHVEIDVSENEDQILSRAAEILTRKRKSQSIH